MTSATCASSGSTGRPASRLRQASTYTRRSSSRDWLSKNGMARILSRPSRFLLGRLVRARLLPELAQLQDRALGTLRLARHAGVAAVQDQPVVRVVQVLGRDDFQKMVLHVA